MSYPSPVRAFLVCAAVGVMACNPLHTKTDAASAVRDLQQTSYSETPKGSSQIHENWQTFGDAALQARLAVVFKENLSLARGAARIKAAQAASRAANATYWPSLDLSASRSKSQSFMLNRTFEQEQMSMSVAATYEIDLFNRLGSVREAALHDKKASTLDVIALKLTLAATYADQWFQRNEARLALDLYANQIQTSETFLALTKHRFHHGLATATDVLQQEQQVGALETLRPQLESRLHLLTHQLALLEGRVAQREAMTADIKLPSPVTLPTLGVPAALLISRPDVQAAQARVSASDARVSAALAGRLPSFRVSGNLGVGAQSFSALFDQWLYGLTASAMAPIFDGGRRKAEVEQQRALLDQALKQYRETYLTAIKEVQDALVLIEQEDSRVASLRRELGTAEALLDESKKRYLSGVGQYILVLNALQSLQRKQRELLSARRAQLTHRISLWRALGGASVKPKSSDREEN